MPSFAGVVFLEVIARNTRWCNDLMELSNVCWGRDNGHIVLVAWSQLADVYMYRGEEVWVGSCSPERKFVCLLVEGDCT